LFYNVAFFSIFLYLFAIVGVAMFKLPDPEKLSPAERTKYELYIAEAPHAPNNSPEPFGTLHESMFTLFRVMTGDDWTDVRYNLLSARECGLLKVPPAAITLYHVCWFVISAFLLLNLVVGAILNNYQIVMEEQRKRRELSC
jgi:voltage-gated sodium channel